MPHMDQQYALGGTKKSKRNDFLKNSERNRNEWRRKRKKIPDR